MGTERRPALRRPSFTAFVVVALVAAGLSARPRPASATTVATCGTDGTPAVVALADPSFYVDSSAGLDATYGGYTVRAGGTAENSLWLSLDGFTGGSVGLAPGQPGSVAVPNIAAGASATSYLLLKAAAATATPQSHVVTLHRGHPSAGDTVCRRTFTYSGVYEAIKALANKVTSVTASTPATAQLGDAVTVDVVGKTGTLGAGPTLDPGVLSYAPNALSSFPASAWRLEKTTMTISPDGVAPAQTYVNRLYLPGASGPDRPYTARYVFRAIGPAESGSAVQPVQYIASGTQVKHTDIGGGVTGTLPAVSKEANVQLAKSASAAVLPSAGATVTYTVTATNLGGGGATVDRLVDTLPAGAVYQAGTSTLGGGATGDPFTAGRQLSWSGPIEVPPGGSVALTYDVRVAGTAGRHTNAAVAYFGTAELDASRDVTVSDPATATVTVLDAAGSARAVADAATTDANAAVLVGVLANDSSTGGFPLAVASVGSPSHGIAAIRPGGAVSYTPATGYAGVDSFPYTVSDGYSTATATVTVTVNPLARSDTYVTARSTTLNGATVLANDACTGCTVALVTGPSTGTLTLATNGTFTYAAPNQNQTVTFTYRATAAGGASATATATVYVNAAGPDAATTAYGTPVTVAVTANDTCPGGGNCVISAGTVAPAHGTVSYSGVNVTYTPAAGFWGLDSFNYNLNGGAGATVTVMTAPPVATVRTSFGAPVAADVDTVGFTGVTSIGCAGCVYALSSSAAHGAVTLGATTGEVVYAPDSSYAGTDTFAYAVTDPASGLTVVGSVAVTVGPDAADDTASTLVGQDATVAVLGNDACPGTCTVTLVAGSGPSTGTVTLNGDRTVTFSSAPAHDIGVVTFQYRIASSLAPSITDTATATVTVEGAVADAASTTPGSAIAVDVAANDPCTGCTVTAVGAPSAGTAAVQPGGTIMYTAPATFSGTTSFTYHVTKNGRSTSATVTVTVLPDAVADQYATSTGTALVIDPRTNDVCVACLLVGATSPDGGGSAVVAPDGQSITYTPGVGGGGVEHFDYTLRDTAGHTTSAAVAVTVNAPPSAGDDDATTGADTPVVIDVLANDWCTGCTPEPAADPASGTVSFRADGKAQYSPAAGFTGADAFRYFVIDAATGLTAEATVHVTVLPRAEDDTAATAEGVSVDVDVLGNDACTACFLTITSEPDHGTASVESAGILRYQPAPGFEGTDHVGYRLTDPATGRTAEAVVVVSVSNATADAVTTGFETGVDVNVLANDTCAGCTLVSLGEPSHGTAGVVAGVVRYTPAGGFWGLDRFTYRAGSGGVTSTADVTVLVAPPPPRVVTGTNTTATGTLLGDAPCEGCGFTIVTPPDGGDVTLDADGSWSYTPVPDTNPEDTVTYRVFHPASGTSVTGTLTIVVRPSQITVTVVVVNDGGGTRTAADFPVTVNGSPVSSGATGTFPAGAAYTVGQVVPDGYAQTGIECVDTDTAADAGHPFTLPAGHHVECTVTDDDLSTTPEVTLTKSAAPPVDDNDSGRVDAGDTIAYSYLVANTGNVTVTGLIVTDDHLPSVCAIASLDPGGNHTCTATYPIIQADVDAGGVTNVAGVEGDAPGAVTVTATDTVTVALARIGTAAVVTSVTGRDDLDHSGGDSPGDLVHFRVVATNTGTTTLSDAVVVDTLTTGSQSCATLAPGASCTLDVGHAVTQGDLDAGSLDDTGTLEAVAAGGADVTAQDTATASLDAAGPALSIAKSLVSEVDADGSGDRGTGDVLTYEVVATNTGGRTAHGVSVVDELTGDREDCGALAPGATCTLTAEHTVTVAEALADRVVNRARAGGDDAPEVDTTLTSPVVHRDGLSLAVSLQGLDATVAGPHGRIDAGDRVAYRYTVTNTGEGAVHDVALTGPRSGDMVCPTDRTLAAGQSFDCTVDHPLTQAELDAGSLDAGAGATAVTADARPVDATTALTTGLPAQPGLAFSKTVAGGPNCDGASDRVDVAAGSDVTWCFSVTNTGNVTLEGVVVADAPLGVDAVIGRLAPGATRTASRTAAAVDLANTAAARGVHAGVTTRSTDDVATVAVTPPATPAGYRIAGTLWFDVDEDGQHDPGEPLLPGALVSLRTAPAEGRAAVRATAGEGAPVRGTPAATPDATAVTGPGGQYEFTGVAPGRYLVVARAGALPASWDTDGLRDWNVTVSVASADVTADFASTPAGSIVGRVTSRTTGQPVAGAVLSCTWAGLDGVPGTADDVPFAATAGPDGSYVIAAAPPGSFSCTATDPTTGDRDTFPAAVSGQQATQADATVGVAAGGPSSGGPSSGGRQTLPAVRDDELPRTGVERRWYLLGIQLVAAGVALVLASRRRT